MVPGGAEVIGDGTGGVGGAGIDDDDFGGDITEAGEAAVQVFLLVESDDEDGEGELIFF